MSRKSIIRGLFLMFAGTLMFLQVGTTSVLADIPNFTNLSGGFDHTTGTFNFTYNYETCPSGNPCPVSFKVKITADTQYFESGWYTQSPIVLHKLNTWSAYTCGRTLSWQISTNKGETSTPQSSTITNCYTFDNLVGRFYSNAAIISFTDNGFVPSPGEFKIFISPLDYVPDDINSWRAWYYQYPPIRVSFLNLWGLYPRCGNTVYWKILSKTGVLSPIQNSVISCASL